MNEIIEPSKIPEETPKTGYYIKGQGALYSTDLDEINKKIVNNPDFDTVVEFRGNIEEELSRCIKNSDNEEGIKGIKNVLSIGLKDLYESTKNENFREEIQKTKKLVECLIEQYKESFYLLFTPEHEPSTILHSLNLMALSLHVYQYIKNNYPEYLSIGSIQDFALAGLLHDTGKIYIEDIVKKTEKLSDSDWERIKKHPQDGYNLLKKTGTTSERVLNATLYHHRRFNNTGYPELAPGDKVLPLTYLIGIIDSLEAITSKSRIHNANREVISMEKALGMLHRDIQTKTSLFYPIDLYNIIINSLTNGEGVFKQS